MPAQPLPVDWEAIKLAAVAGVPYKSLAIQFGIIGKDGKPDTNAIRQRASRGDWPIPARVRQVAKNIVRKHLAAGGSLPAQSSKERSPQSNTEADAKTCSLLSSNLVGNGGNVTERNGGAEMGDLSGKTEGDSAQIAAVTMAAHLLSNARASTLEASNRALSSLKSAPALLPVTSPADLKTLMQVARIAAGLDRPETAVQVNLFGSASAVSGGESSFVELEEESYDEGYSRGASAPVPQRLAAQCSL